MWAVTTVNRCIGYVVPGRHPHRRIRVTRHVCKVSWIASCPPSGWYTWFMKEHLYEDCDGVGVFIMASASEESPAIPRVAGIGYECFKLTWVNGLRPSPEA